MISSLLLASILLIAPPNSPVIEHQQGLDAGAGVIRPAKVIYVWTQFGLVLIYLPN